MLLTLLYVVLAVILVVALAGVVIGYAISAPRYTGPVSDHFDGKNFFTPGAPAPKSLPDVLRWQLNHERTQPWPPYHADLPAPTPLARVEGDPVRVTFINHSTVLLQFDGLNVLTDPIFDQRVSPFQFAGPKRNQPPGVPFNDLPAIDVLLLSHNHWDHLEIGTVKRICARYQPMVFCPLGVKAFLEQHGCRKVIEMDWQQTARINPTTTLHCVPAQHFTGRGTFDRSGTLWAGYVLDSQAVGKLYFAGDSGYGPHFQAIGNQFGPLRLALIPIGAYKPNWFMSPVHCSPQEAVQIHQDVNSQQSVAIHFGTFPLADDGETEPVDDLARALADRNIPASQFRALKNGECLVI